MDDIHAAGTTFVFIKELDEEFKKTSDRGAVIAGAAFLDMLLRELLTNFFVPGTASQDKILFEGNGPLSTFSSRTSLAFRLGLIAEQEYRMLRAVRAIRNEFAHILSTSFNTARVKDFVKSLALPHEMVFTTEIFLPKADGAKPPPPKISLATADQPRLIFQDAVSNLMHRLSPRCMDASSTKRAVPRDYKTTVEVYEANLRHYDDGLRRVSAMHDRLQKAKERMLALASRQPPIDAIIEQERKTLEKEIHTLSDGLKNLGENDKQFMTAYRLLKYVIEQTKIAQENLSINNTAK